MVQGSPEEVALAAIAEELEMDKVSGLNYSLDAKTLTTQSLIMKNLLQYRKLSVNLGGNFDLAAATLGWDLDLPVTLHGGLTKPWMELNSKDWNKKPGVFVGFEFRF